MYLDINAKKRESINISDNMLINNITNPSKNPNSKEGFIDLEDLALSIKRKSVNYDPTISLKKKFRATIDLKGNGILLKF